MNNSEKFQCIYADPPWHLKSAGRPLGQSSKQVDGKQVFDFTHKSPKPLPYKTMSLQQIKELPIGNVVAPAAHLYLWVPNAYVPVANEIIEAWGFKYSTTLVWAKNAMGGGFGGAFKITTEFLFFARKGQLKEKEIHIGTWFNYKRAYDERGKPAHSRKPEPFAEMIEKVSPGPYLELFARRERPNWSIYGDQVANSIKLI